MRRLLSLVVIAGVAYYAWNDLGLQQRLPLPGATGQSEIASAYRQQRSNVQLRSSGTVTRVLSDDNDGSRHQRFIVDVGAGHTVLVAHNIDLAPRVAGLQVGDTVEFFGEYEWNAKGGVVHWTHRDPRGRHAAGWLRHRGRTYQ